jgi:long-chain acyl-CoA synthetase
MLKNVGNLISPNCDLNKIALIDLGQSTPRLFSFGEIDQLSNAVARGLHLKKITVGDRIAVLSNNSVELVSTLFGSMRLGAIPVLINNKLSNSQIQDILTESESKLLFTDQLCNFNLQTINFENDFKNFLDNGEFDCYTPTNDTAVILYTSGSSGNAKGVRISHAGHIWGIERNVKYDVHFAERICLISAPLYHANGLTTFTGSFLGKATIVLLPKFNSSTCIKAIELYRPDILYCVPTMLAMMLQDEYIQTADLSSLQQIRSASSNVSRHLVDAITRYFPNARVLNSYGITEVGPALFGPHPDGISRPPTSVGYPAEGIEYRIINDILEIKSPSMMTSYYNKNTSLTKDGFFITNDLFRVDDNGFYYFLGRADDMFKCGGNSVYPSQIEEILESHPAVTSAVVLGIEDNIKGHKPHAFVILANDQSVSEQELKQYVLERAPAHQHPRKIWAVKEFPMLAGNKVDKQALKQLSKNYQ